MSLFLQDSWEDEDTGEKKTETKAAPAAPAVVSHDAMCDEKFGCAHF